MLSTNLPKATFRCVSKKENQGLFKYQIKISRFECWYRVNEWQSYLIIRYSLISPNLECFYPVIQVGLTGMNNVWDSKLTPLQGPFWAHRGDFKTMTWIQDLPHSPCFLRNYQRSFVGRVQCKNDSSKSLWNIQNICY